MDNNDALIRKLGLAQAMHAYTLHAPAGYLSAYSITSLSNYSEVPDFDWLQAFYMDRKTLEDEAGALKAKLAKNGQLWLSWPKKASGVASDLDDNVVRNAGLAVGLVDVKVAAIDDTWSAIKFVYRLKDR